METKYAIGKTSGVFINDSTVTKIFNIRNKALKATRGSYRDCYNRELECLKRLSGSPHFPQLISNNDESMAIQMTQVGDSLYHTWPEYNIPDLRTQCEKIVEELDRAQVQYFYPGLNKDYKLKIWDIFPLSNFCVDDTELVLIDFETANPIGTDWLTDHYKKLYANYSSAELLEYMQNSLIDANHAWVSELRRKLVDKTKLTGLSEQPPREVWSNMTKFTQPSEKIVKEWKNYQKRFGKDEANDRIDKIGMRDLLTPETRLVDIGCNEGYFSKELGKNVKSVVGVEPHVELSDPTKTVTWFKGTFNEFLESDPEKFDVLLSLAVSIQLRDFGGLTEQEIVDGYASLLVPGGIVVHETQKLDQRPNNQEHTKWMLEAFATKFEIIKHGQARSGGGREYYHFRKK